MYTALGDKDLAFEWLERVLSMTSFAHDFRGSVQIRQVCVEGLR